MGKRVISILVCILAMILFKTITVNAQEKTAILVSVDNNQVSLGQEFKTYIKAENVYDLYGVQFTINYNTELLDLVSNSLDMKNGFKSFGGETVDKSKGIVTYPLINSSSKKELQKEQLIGELTFKAKAKGGNIFNMSNIKAVNSDAVVISNNTNYSTSINIVSNGVISTEPVVVKPDDKNGSGEISKNGTKSTETKLDDLVVEKYNDSSNNEESNGSSSEASSENEKASKEASASLKDKSEIHSKSESGSESVSGSKNTIIAVIIGIALILIGISYKFGVIRSMIDKSKLK